jgi:hypothetical protein
MLSLKTKMTRRLISIMTKWYKRAAIFWAARAIILFVYSCFEKKITRAIN